MSTGFEYLRKNDYSLVGNIDNKNKYDKMKYKLNT